MAYEKGAQTFKTKVMNKATLHTVNYIVGVDYKIFQLKKMKLKNIGMRRKSTNIIMENKMRKSAAESN